LAIDFNESACGIPEGGRGDFELLNGDYDTVTLHEWKQLRAEAPGLGTALLPPRREDEGAAAPPRSCEWCGKEIPTDADRRRRFCSSSCRARAAKRRKPKPAQPPVPAPAPAADLDPLGAVPARAPGADPAATAAAPDVDASVSAGDLESMTGMAAGLLACDGVGEVEFRVRHWTVVVRR
jgi:hypothetical protein